MGKRSGLGSKMYVGGTNLSGDVGAIGAIAGRTGVVTVTSIEDLAPSLVGGRRDGEISFNAWFNPDRAHPVLSALPDADSLLCVTVGNALGSAAACMAGKRIDYAGSVGDDGALPMSVKATSNRTGLEWGRLVTDGPRTDVADVAAGDITSGLDDIGTGNYPSDQTAHGASVYVFLTALAGGDITFSLVHSDDDNTFADVAGGASSSMSAPGAQRWQTAATETIERYINIATSGTFTSATFVAVVVRHTSPALGA